MKRTVYLKTLSLEDARSLILRELSPSAAGRCEKIPVSEALGRITAAPVTALLSNPNYNASAMDGIAVSAGETRGADPRSPLTLRAPGQFSYIDTGDPLPEGRDAVIMIEDLRETGESEAVITAPAHPWQNVRPVGEDVVAGELILPSRSKVRPMDIGALIAGGISEITVFSRPRAGIIPTGTELIEKPEEMKAGKILDSNSRMFEALITEYGGEPRRYPPVPDDYGLLKQAVSSALEECDMVILGAGSSAGSEDYSRAIIEEMGELLFHGVSIKPGKPALFGRTRPGGGEPVKPLICIPGYPVSAYMVFDRLVQPLICTYLGISEAERPVITGTLTRPLVSSLEHLEFVRVKCGRVGDRVVVTPLSRGAGITMSLVQADGIVEVPREYEGFDAGREVTVSLLKEWSRISRQLVSIGSHDILMDILAELMKEEGAGPGLSSTHSGSMGGVMALKKGECHLAPVHLLESGTGIYNRYLLERYGLEDTAVMVKGVKRIQGLMLQPGNPLNIRGLEDLFREGVQFVNRQRGAGTRVLLDYLCEKAGLKGAEIEGYEREMTTHMAVAEAVRSGSADAGLGVASAAAVMGLDFIPVGEEEYDFLFRRDAVDTEGGRLIREILASSRFAEELEKRGGYALDQPGVIIER
jgi:putative molybdopterin biosynthesis protein